MAKKAETEKPLSIPELIKRYNDAAAKAKDAKAEADACKEPLKAWAQKVGNKTSPTEIYAEKVIDGHTCIVRLGLSTGFEPDIGLVLAKFGVDALVAAELLSVNVKGLRELAVKDQVPMKDLGEDKSQTISIGKCEAIKKGAKRG